MMNTPTPRTDALRNKLHENINTPNIVKYMETILHANTLETELTAAREELAEWSILKGWGGTPEIINDFIKGQQTRIHYAQNIEEELTAVTEQRDKLLEQQEQWRLSSVCRELVEQRDEAREELKAVTEQRDKLAELSGFGEFDKPTEP